MKKIFAVVLVVVMAMALATTAFADQVTADKTYEGGIVVDGSSSWNTAGSGETFLITANGVTVTFENEPFVRDTENWSNFVFETIATDGTKGITLRADAFGWTYGDGSEPTYAVTTSWGDDWAAFKEAAPGKVELTAKKTDANTVVFNIAFENGATEVYTVTYPDGAPEELYFQVGADGGKITLQSAVFGGANTGDNSGDQPGDDEAGKTGFATIALAVVAVSSGAYVVSKKRH